MVNFQRAVLWLMVCGLLVAQAGAAETFELLFSDTSGEGPAGLVSEGADGSIYGTTAEGGASGNGTVFRLNKEGVLSTLISFNKFKGRGPQGGALVGSDGNLYGTTVGGGANDKGTLFKLTPDGTLTTLVSFDGTNGSYPYCELVEGNDGNFYGTTFNGGTNDLGTVFKVTRTGTLSTLASFNSVNGSRPGFGLIQAKDGDFYGTTREGGANSVGVVFKVTAEGVLSVVTSFGALLSGSSASGLIQGSDGKFYGTTFNGGADRTGAIFKMTPDGTLSAFGGAFTAIPNPTGKLAEDNDGNLWGTTSSANIFKLSPDGTLTAMASGIALDVRAGLVRSSDGTFYATASRGGNQYGSGTVVKISANGAQAQAIPFNTSRGIAPDGRLVEEPRGAFYGTTLAGGTAGQGTIFQVTGLGTFTTLSSFSSGSYSSFRRAGVVLGNDGNFYGTVPDGGGVGGGSFFRMTPGGMVTTLASFSASTGTKPAGELFKATDGNFYGTTFSGGSNNKGTVFRVTSTGTLTALASLGAPDGRGPAYGVIQASDGSFYGTTAENEPETVFKVTSAGELRTLATFNSTSGTDSAGALVEVGDGSLYGTCLNGGASGLGTLFKITPGGTLTAGRSFSGADGSKPNAGLALGSDGKLYGTTSMGGKFGFGTIFRATLDGVVEVLHSFDGLTAAFPRNTPIFGDDGNLYGTAAGLAIWRLHVRAVTTSGTSDLSTLGATVTGVIEGLEADAAMSFDYGTTSDYGSSATSTLPATVSALSKETVSAQLTGLTPHTVYHFRLKATTHDGVSLSTDQTFTTLNTAPTAGTSAVTVSRGMTVSLPFASTDVDGDAIEVKTISASAGAPFDLGAMSGDQLDIRARASASGTGTISFTVTDNFGGTASGTLEVTVTPAAPLSVLAAGGERVPGAGEAGSGVPAGALWKSFGVPCATGAAEAAFRAVLRLGTDTTTVLVLQNVGTNKITVLAQVGDKVPGMLGVKFVAFKDPLAVRCSEARTAIAFHATVSGVGVSDANNRVLCRRWLGGADAGIEILGRTGAAGPSLDPAGIKAAVFTSVGLGPDGTLWARVVLRRGLAGVSDADDQALVCWAPHSSTPNVVVREGMALPLGDGIMHRVKTIATLVAAAGSPGHGRWLTAGGLALRLGFSDGTNGIFVASYSGGSAIPGLTLKTRDIKPVQARYVGGEPPPWYRSHWPRFGLPDLAADGGVSVVGYPELNATPLRLRAAPPSVFHREDAVNDWTAVAIGTWYGFNRFKDPVSNENGEVVFVAKHPTANGVRTAIWSGSQTSSVWWGGQIRAEEGRKAPGAGEARFARFESVALPDGHSAGLLLTAILQTGLDGAPGPGGTLNRNNRGLWAVDSTGELRLMLREGFALPGAAPRALAIKDFTILGAVAGSPGQARGYDDQGGVLCRVAFSDHSTAIIQLEVP